MKTPRAMQAGLIEKFTRFLEEHSGFSPELMGENAYVYGFHLGRCSLSIDDMERLITTRVDGRLAALLRTAPQLAHGPIGHLSPDLGYPEASSFPNDFLHAKEDASLRKDVQENHDPAAPR